MSGEPGHPSKNKKTKIWKETFASNAGSIPVR